MTNLSSFKLGLSSMKTKLIALSVLSVITPLLSSNVLANSCSKSDIDYYLQRGFTNAQVVQLCAGTAAPQSSAQTYQAQAQTQQTQQSSQLREDQSYLSAALDAEGVTMSPQKLTLLPRECIEYGPPNNIDLVETVCVNTKLSVNFTGMKVGKASRGFLLVRDATVKVKGKIQREFVGINDLRRQDKEAILETLSANPSEVSLKVRRGIDPKAVASRLLKYAK